MVTAPPDVAASLDRITAQDRAWFELNPHAEYRTRPAAPGEFWPTFDSASVKYVIVHQVRPGFRLRCPVLRLHLPETERLQ